MVGTGIAGNVAAYLLRQEHDVTVFEASDYVGGHTNTVDVYANGREYQIDTGFIVYNDRTYPNFTRILSEIGQDSQPSEMSFSVQADDGRIEYKGSSLNGLFAQRSNLLRPSFYRMIRDILRFNETQLRDDDQSGDLETLETYLRRNSYGKEFVNHYLVPMAAAIWSAQPLAVMEMPVRFLVRFFMNHGLIQISDRPVWRVVKGGSRAYVEKLVAAHRDRIRLNSPVESVRRTDNAVQIYSATGGREHFDAVFLACHADEALALLADATSAERDVLGSFHYQRNEAILHTDESLMPKCERAWAAWNYHLPKQFAPQVSVTYSMNILQRLTAEDHYLVTLNSGRHIDPDKIVYRTQYAHPVYSGPAIAAQQRQAEINWSRTFYCGAYWRNGFHEDGVVSAISAVEHFREKLSNGQLHLRRAG